MSTVYIVTSGDYSAYSIDAVFSTEPAADQYADEIGGMVEEWPIDRLDGIPEQHYWYVEFLADGVTVRPEHTSRRIAVDMKTWRDPVFAEFRESCWVSPKFQQCEDVYEDSYGNPTVLPATKRCKQYEPCWGVHVFADDEQHAIKVAAEQVAMAKAQQAGIG